MDFTDASNAYQVATPIIQRHVEEIEKIVKNSGVSLEGNSFYYHDSLTRFEQLLTKQINLFWAGSQADKKILEIGFNAGHSAMLFLCGRGTSEVDFTIFDLGDHKYVKPCMEYVRSQWPSARIEYIEGDSTKTLPAFAATKPEHKGTYDVVHVDGGHDRHVVLSDVSVAIDLVKIGGLMILDDTNNTHINDIADACVMSCAFVEEKILDTVGYPHRILRRVK